MRRTNRLRRLLRSRRGAVLAISIFLVSLVAVGSLLMAQATNDHQRINWRRRELARALYLAEAGVSLIQDYSNEAANYTPDPNLFTYVPPSDEEIGGTGIVYASGNLEDRFPTLHAFLTANSGVWTMDESTLDSLPGTVNSFVSDNNEYIGKVREIQLFLPGATGAPATPEDIAYSPELIVRSVGRSTRNLERTVVAFLDINPIIEIRLPAGLINSDANAALFGNGRVHWGEAWSRDSFQMLNKSQMDYVREGAANYDRWAKWITEGTLHWPNNWSWGVNRDLYNPSGTNGAAANHALGKYSPNRGAIGGDQNAGDGYDAGTQFRASGAYEKAFFQIDPGTLPWPNLYDTDTYYALKEFAIENGRYYTTNSSGQIFKDGVNQGDFLASFAVPSGVDRDGEPYDFVFIDTTDQQPPRADGSNLSTITASGSSNGLKGFYWIGANFSVTGVGDPPDLSDGQSPPLDPFDPNSVQTQTLEKIFLDGVLMSPGRVDMAGNAGVYGSVVAGGGFGGGGTPDIWYNWRLAQGLELFKGNVGSRLKVMSMTNYSEGQPS